MARGLKNLNNPKSKLIEKKITLPKGKKPNFDFRGAKKDPKTGKATYV